MIPVPSGLLPSELMNNYNPNIHHRCSIRLKGYDYSQQGLYFIICNTVCQQKQCIAFQVAITIL